MNIDKDLIIVVFTIEEKNSTDIFGRTIKHANELQQRVDFSHPIRLIYIDSLNIFAD